LGFAKRKKDFISNDLCENSHASSFALDEGKKTYELECHNIYSNEMQKGQEQRIK
jgi:hypothetical protein